MRSFFTFSQLAAILLAIMQADIYNCSVDNELAHTIALRSAQMWQAYQDKNEPAHSATLTEDYISIHPNGTMHGRATVPQIAAAAIIGFRFSERKVWRLGEHAALSTYYADVDLPAGRQPSHIRFAASEVWVKCNGEWKCKFYQGTPAQ